MKEVTFKLSRKCWGIQRGSQARSKRLCRYRKIITLGRKRAKAGGRNSESNVTAVLGMDLSEGRSALSFPQLPAKGLVVPLQKLHGRDRGKWDVKPINTQANQIIEEWRQVTYRVRISSKEKNAASSKPNMHLSPFMSGLGIFKGLWK